MKLEAKREAGHVRDMFDGIAPRYDLMNRLMTFGRDQHWRRFLVKQASLSDGDHVLDLATGTGDIAFEVLRRYPNARVVGGDFSPNMIAHGKKRPGGEKLEWLVCDAMDLPFEDERFDAVTFGYLLRNVADVDKALQEVYRVLKPGGRVVCLDTTPPRNNIMKPFILAYLKFAMPLLGRLFTGDGSAYAYLAGSTLSFRGPDELKAIFERNGFQQVNYKPFMFHTIAVHRGVK